jgi:hypothetical protein
MRLKYTLLAALAAAAMGGEARAQSEPPTSCVADSNGNWQANGNRVFLGTAPCTAARGDALAAEIARALAAEGAAGAAALPKAGGTMTGPLVLSGAPTAPLNPATKAYTDAATGANATAIGTEATRAAGAEGAISGNLSAEITRAQGVEATLASLSALATEATRAQTAEQANATAIGTEAATARNAASLTIGTVSAVRLPAISALTGYVDPTNAGNITSGTMSADRLPAITTTTVGEGSNLYFTAPRAAAAAPVQTVAGRTGAVTLTSTDIGGLAAAAAAAAPLQSLAGLTGAPTSAQVAAALGGTTGTQLAFGNDARIPAGVAGGAGGAAVLGSDGTVGAMLVKPTGGTATQTLSAKLREHYSVRDFAGVTCGGTVDDSTALAAATASLAGTGADLLVPKDCKILLAGASQVSLVGMNLIGENGRDVAYPYGQSGSQIYLTDTVRAPFTVGSGWAVRRLTFLWPNQTEIAAAANAGQPIIYPPLMVNGNSGAAQVIAWQFTDNQVTNAYDVFDFSSSGGMGGALVSGNIIYNLHYAFILNRMAVESFIVNNTFTPFAYQNVALAGPTYNLRNYSGINAEVIRVVGAGTQSTAPGPGVDGLKMINNYTFGYGYGTHVVGGWLNISSITAGGYDGVLHPLTVDAGGLVSSLQYLGGLWITYRYGDNTADAPAIEVLPTSYPASTLLLNGVNATSVNGQCINFTAGTGSLLSLVDTHFPACGGTTGQTGPFDAVTFNAPGGTLNVLGGEFGVGQNRTGGNAFTISAATSAVLTGARFNGWGAVINTAVAGVAATGNRSTNSVGTNAIIGAQQSAAIDTGNSWDVGVAAGLFSSSRRNTSSASAASATVLGGFSSVNNAYEVSLGGLHYSTGYASVSLGLGTQDRGRYGVECLASRATGTSYETCRQNLRSVTTSVTATRLTADGGAANAANTVNLPSVGLSYRLQVKGICRDITTSGNYAAFDVARAVLDRPTTGNVTYAGDAPTYLVGGTGSTLTVTLAADTANNGLSLSVTTPNANEWHCSADAYSVETQ